MKQDLPKTWVNSWRLEKEKYFTLFLTVFRKLTLFHADAVFGDFRAFLAIDFTPISDQRVSTEIGEYLFFIMYL